MEHAQIVKLAELALKIGVNLQKGQKVVINCPVGKSEIGRVFAEKAYELGASLVKIDYNDELLTRLNYEKADVNALENIAPSFVMSREEYVKEKFCYIAIDADDPNLLSGVDHEKIQRVVKARRNALRAYNDAVMNNEIRWTIVAVPAEAWAKQVFPNSKNPEEELWTAIAKTIRLDAPDPVKAWKEHVEILHRRAGILNKNNFEYIRFENSVGTNLTVGLADGHKWIAAEESDKDGVKFIANMPTEEIFTSPHAGKVNGTLKNALPLAHDGNIIDGFSITFKDGRITDFSAEKGYETLKNLIETDEGSHHLGEIALIGKNSPIAESGILYYNTLFDENASCHLAIGKAYPTTVNGGEDMTKEELAAKGVNDSLVHCDFMIGTKDLKVTGIGFDGKEVPLFIDGEWII